MPTSRRVVTYSGRQPSAHRRGARMWGYTYDDLAQLLGTTAGALRVRTSRGTFDPGDLEAIAREWALRQQTLTPDCKPALSRTHDPYR